MLIHRRLARFLRRYGLLSLSALVAFTLLAGASPASSVAATDLLEETVQEEKSQEVFVTRSASLTYMSSGSEVALEEGQNVTVSAQGSEQETTAENETVSALLDRLDVEVGPLDMVAVDFTGSHVGITVDSEILVYEREEKVTESPVTYIYNDVLPTWSETVVQQGQDGVHTEIYEVVYAEGRQISRQLVEETDTQPTETIIEKGTLENFAPNQEPVAEIVDNGDGTGKIVLENGIELTYNQSLTMKATAYATGDPGVGTITATGTTVRPGTVAVDPRQIPYGTKMYIVSNDGAYLYGFSIAEDTGGTIRQNRIDLFFPSQAACIQFGVRNCTVYILD